MRIFSGSAHPRLAEGIGRHLGIELGRIVLGHFPDSETKVQVLDDVRGREAFVVQSLCRPVNESLMELLIIVDALRRASASSICAVIPYFAYARQDRKHAGRVPITAKLVANLITTSGVNRVLTMDLHASQIQGFFDIPVDHLYAAPVHIEYLMKRGLEKPVILAPDIGGVKMAGAFAKRLGGDLAILQKERMNDHEVRCGHVIGEIEGRDVVIVDDVISTASTASEATKVVRANGAKRIIVLATHGILAESAFARLSEAAPDEIVLTDTIPMGNPPKNLPLTVLSVAGLLGDAVIRIHRNQSVSSLFL
ncbi:MAG: ribose-phosphate pyrophosphokinase [Planctomycetota bacterium]